MSMVYEVRTECDAPECGVLSTQGPFQILFGQEQPKVGLPSGWSLIGNKTYCFKHKITVTTSIDGKDVES